MNGFGRSGKTLSLGDAKEHSTDHAACSVGVLEGKSTSLLPKLAIPERDKLRMKIDSRHQVSFSWEQVKQIADHVQKMDGLGEFRRDRYRTLFLVAAPSGLRASELRALTMDDIDFKTHDSSGRIVGSAEQRRDRTLQECHCLSNCAAPRPRRPNSDEGVEGFPEDFKSKIANLPFEARRVRKAMRNLRAAGDRTSSC